MKLTRLAVLILVLALLCAGFPVQSALAQPTASQPDGEDAALQFAATGETLNVTVDGAPLVVTKYTVTYVADPITVQDAADPTAWQKMHIYVPATAVEDQETAIILAVNNSGWMNSPVPSAEQASVQDGAAYVSDSDTDRTGAALAAGYVFVDVGTRSRGLVDADGLHPGKAPAVVVDAKAAIRYLRLNDALLPGSSERIVITGTSGGGGLSTAIAASGNSADYYPDLAAIGAAGIDAGGNSTLSDDVFAVIAYCPITDLGHADIAYEWQYSDIRQVGDPLKGPVGFIPWYTDELTPEMMDASVALKAQYPDYLGSLELTLDDGTPLTAESMPAAITALAKASVEKAMAAGESVPDLGESWTLQTGPNPAQEYVNNWLDINDARDAVENIDYTEFLKFVVATAPLKGVPSFDVTGTMGVTSQESGESNLFGSDAVEYSNFMEWAWNNNNVAGDGSGLDDTNLTWEQYFPDSQLQDQIKLINPMAYLIDADNGKSAPYWYVRHGLRDRDTSFAVEAALFYAIKNDPTVEDANVGLAYIEGHAGNYDVQEAYAWLAGVLATPEPTPPEGGGTIVWQSDESPTGYYVTFRYDDPEAARVRIYGEWWFTDLRHASVRTSLNATPDEWQDGYTIWKGSQQWPTVDMTQDEETGLWTYTIPLPTGHWGYRFYVGGAEGAAVDDYTDATVTWDPTNPPMLYDFEADDLTNDEYLSHVYVPWDAEKQALTPARAEETPRDGENGEAFFDQVTTDDGFVASFGVYLPYEFDAEREEPYPVLVLFHGGGGSESGWFNNGLIDILDNMIAEGRLEPTVVVTPNGEDHEWDRPLILKNVVDYILPYMVENYNVAEEPDRRAFAGLSMGGATTMYAFFHNTDDFQYFLAMSPPMLEDVDPDYTVENLADKTLWFGYGMYDFVKLRSLYSLFPDEEGNLVLLSQARRPEGSLYEYLIKLSEIGVPFTNIELPFGHDWVLWRMAIVDAFDNVLWK